MPRIETVEYDYKDTDGADMRLKVSYDVDKHGTFSATIPDWLEDNVQALLVSAADGNRMADTRVIRPKTHLYIAGSLLSAVQGLVFKALAEYSAPVMESELIIRYAVTTKAAVWELPDGRIAPNGYVGQVMHLAEKQAPIQGQGHGAWAKELKSVSSLNPARGGFMVMAGAKVLEKITTTRGASVYQSYKRADTELLEDLSNPIWRLNAFVGLSLEPTNATFGDRQFTVHEIPYTPEAAEFFYSMMLGIAQLALQFERFFADKTKLLEQIQSGQLLLGKPGQAPT